MRDGSAEFLMYHGPARYEGDLELAIRTLGRSICYWGDASFREPERKALISRFSYRPSRYSLQFCHLLNDLAKRYDCRFNIQGGSLRHSQASQLSPPKDFWPLGPNGPLFLDSEPYSRSGNRAWVCPISPRARQTIAAVATNSFPRLWNH